MTSLSEYEDKLLTESVSHNNFSLYKCRCSQRLQSHNFPKHTNYPFKLISFYSLKQESHSQFPINLHFLLFVPRKLIFTPQTTSHVTNQEQSILSKKKKKKRRPKQSTHLHNLCSSHPGMNQEEPNEHQAILENRTRTFIISPGQKPNQPHANESKPLVQKKNCIKQKSNLTLKVYFTFKLIRKFFRHKRPKCIVTSR